MWPMSLFIGGLVAFFLTSTLSFHQQSPPIRTGDVTLINTKRHGDIWSARQRQGEVVRTPIWKLADFQEQQTSHRISDISYPIPIMPALLSSYTISMKWVLCVCSVIGSNKQPEKTHKHPSHCFQRTAQVDIISERVCEKMLSMFLFYFFLVLLLLLCLFCPKSGWTRSCSCVSRVCFPNQVSKMTAELFAPACQCQTD